MMRTTSTLLKSLAVLSALLPVCTSTFGADSTIVYDNSEPLNNLNATYAPQPIANGIAFGDEINLGAGPRTLDTFSFAYFLSASANGNEQAVLTLYANDGPEISRTVNGETFNVNTPGTAFYTSDSFNLATGFNTVEASAFNNLQLPNTFTWTVTLQGIDNGEVAGLLVYNPPTVGSSFSDFWQNNNGTWNTYLLPGDIAANFSARVTAVPEPSTIALALVAGLGFIGYRGFKRRSA